MLIVMLIKIELIIIQRIKQGRCPMAYIKLAVLYYPKRRIVSQNTLFWIVVKD